ncbi:RHS repeat domain-containing protein [Rhodocyclus gracilis]|uniref:RHS repeat domain-containing protein n=1 Tax=Rhodocyclus gracilis TaxID=2929842 RepID=UPI001E582908|nr:RHS repeat domain-containing protein [Rhodocyclus gracilis]
MNRRTAVTDATGYRTETAYTLRGDVIGITNANDEKVTFEIDALGRKTAAIDAKGYRSEFAYDENGNLTCSIDANAQAGLQPKNSFGCSESRQYDELNRVTRIIDALNGETSFTYDLAGNRKTYASGSMSLFDYAANNPVNQNDPSGHAALQVGGAVVGGVGGLLTQGGIDLARGRLSSFADYAGSVTGGAAAVTCGPMCAGATAGAVSSATTQGVNWAQGKISSGWDAAKTFATDTVMGAVGGKVADKVVPWLFKEALPAALGTGVANQVKGKIGEAMTWLDLKVSGRGATWNNPVENGFGKSTFDFQTNSGTFVEAKFGTSRLNRGAQTSAAEYWAGLGQFELQTWSYPVVSGIGGASFSAGAAGYSGSAGGGFLIYPNKSNTNMSQAVYSK